jgi:hypothetical protein
MRGVRPFIWFAFSSLFFWAAAVAHIWDPIPLPKQGQVFMLGNQYFIMGSRKMFDLSDNAIYIMSLWNIQPSDVSLEWKDFPYQCCVWRPHLGQQIEVLIPRGFHTHQDDDGSHLLGYSAYEKKPCFSTLVEQLEYWSYCPNKVAH